MDKILSKVLKFQYKNNQIYAAIYWLEDAHEIFRVTIYEDNKTWSGIYCKDMAQQYTNNKLKDEQSSYIEQLKSGLLFNDDLFTYNFSKLNDKTAKFTWKKLVEGTSVILVHGSVHLDRDKATISKSNLLDILLQENLSLKKNVNTLRSTYDLIQDEVTKYKTELNQFLQTKSEVETGLYGRFFQLLNARKDVDLEKPCKECSKVSDKAGSFLKIYD